jgi:hypothetical protein
MRLLDDALVGLIVAMTGLVAISAGVLVSSIKEEDSGSAWIGAAALLLASLIDAWVFSRLV